MILPIVAYGAPILRKMCTDIQPDYPGLAGLVNDMWETMYNSNGVGLAAPQVNRDIRLFIVDSVSILKGLEEDGEENKYPGDEGYCGTFINARLISKEGQEWSYNEGCLSIPKVREDVYRHEKITIHFFDEHFQEHTRTFSGVTARVVLHEYDHIEGRLFIDYLKPLKRRLIKGKLEDITKGKVRTDYRMMFAR